MSATAGTGTAALARLFISLLGSSVVTMSIFSVLVIVVLLTVTPSDDAVVVVLVVVMVVASTVLPEIGKRE